MVTMFFASGLALFGWRYFVVSRQQMG